MVKKIIDNIQMPRKKAGRPRYRWMDGVLEAIRRLKINNWWVVVMNRKAWRKLLTRPGSNIMMIMNQVDPTD